MKNILIAFSLFLIINVAEAQNAAEGESQLVLEQPSLLKVILGNEIVSGIIFFVIIIIITYFVANFIKNRLTSLLEGFADQLTGREEVQGMIIKAVTITVWLFGFSAAAGIIGFDLGIFMGGIGIGVGFGLQALLSNFIAGIIVIFQGKYKVGDVIEVEGKMGTVRVMDTLFTEIEQFDGIKFYIPNSNFLSQTVINITANDKRRCEILVGVDYDTDIVKAKQVINKVLSTFPNILPAPDTKILITEFDDSSIGLKIMFWLTINDDFFGTRSNVIETINLAFRQAEITIPFPQITMSKRGE